MSENGTKVTRAELAAHIASIDRRLETTERRLEQVATRREVRLLIMVGFIGSQLVAGSEIAKAAVSIFGF